jgi:hypothetical protein
MVMMKKISVGGFVICVLLSCNNNKTMMPEFTTTKILYAEYIRPEVVIAPTFFIIQGGYLCTYSLRKDTMIDLFTLPDLTHKNSIGIRGQGPGEFQSFPWPCKSNNDYIYIRGYTPQIIKQFLVDSTANFVETNEFKLDTYESFGPMHVVQDSLLIYPVMVSQPEMKEQITVKKLDLNQGRETGIIVIPTTRTDNTSLDPNRPGGFDVNDSFIVCAYLFKKQIDIYSVHNMALIRRLEDRSNHPVQIRETFEENIPQYQGIYAGEKYFYALYNNKGCKFNTVYPGSQSIEVFDYDGNAIVEYTFDNLISLFAIDEVNNVLYAYDETKEDFILKYNLP